MRSNRSRRRARWPARVASKVASSGSIPKPEDMELALPQAEVAGHDGVDLDARDEGQAGRDRVVGDDLAIAGQRVVVGQGEEADPDSGGRADQDRRRQDAVRAGRVGVQVDRRGAGWLDPAGTRRRQRVVAAPARRGRHVTPRRAAGSAPSRGPDRSPGRCRPGGR